MVRCIVADDDQDTVNVFCDLLNLIDVDVIATANDGEEIVNMYKKHNPDVVFTDLNMPKYDGFYAIEMIKDMDLNAKIIAITGDRNAGSFYLDALNVIIINKPFDMHAIKQALTDIFLLKDMSKVLHFKVEYKFKNDGKKYLCVLTYPQYRNLRQLPIIQECEIINNEQKNSESYQKAMHVALKLASKNDPSQILKLSHVET
jgi:CheY-like chemotaxis protein